MKKRAITLLLAALLAAVALVGCSSGSTNSSTAAPATSAAAGASADSTDAKKNVTLNVINWADYIDPELITEFEAEYPYIKINYTPTNNNETMLVQLEKTVTHYDVAVPSDYIIERMLASDSLQEIDKTKLTNYNNLMASCLDQSFDPGNKYSIPYMWGTVGILYNTTMVTDTVDSWNILWDANYSKKIFMYDSLRDSIGVTLKKLGYSMNTRDEAALAAAQQALIEQKPLVLAYAGDDIKDKMIGNNGALALVWSGDAMFCMDENPDLAYAVPKEGSNLWFDNLVIPAGAQNVDEAHLFIDFLCRPEIAKRNAEYIGYSTSNQAAMELLGEGYADNATYNPPQDVLDRCEIFGDLGTFVTEYEKIWMNVLGA